ncbi:MAG: hypothetical protein VX633_02260 [Verrucomicrobiota bacterium]|nr:hypothetical protein [Verrucomicrobiota bacterium]
MGLGSLMVRFLPLLLLAFLALARAETLSFDASNPTINLGNSGASHYRINGFNDPVLALRSGVTYTVNRSSGGHPLVFAYNDTDFPDAVTYSGNLEAGTAFRQSGVLGSGDPGWLFRVAPNSSSEFTFPPALEGKEVFYYCEISGHRGMIGKVTIEPPITEPVSPVINSLTLDGGTLVLAFSGAPNTNFVVKSTTDLSDPIFPTTENTTPAVITTNGIGTASLTLETAARPALFLRIEQVP